MSDNSGDTEPAPLVEPGILVRQLESTDASDSGSWRKVGIQSTGDQLVTDSLNSVLLSDVVEPRPTWLTPVKELHRLGLKRVVDHANRTAPLAAGQLETDMLTRHVLLQRHPECAGEFRRECMSVMPASEQSLHDVGTLQGDQWCAGCNTTVLQTRPLDHPTARPLVVAHIDKRLELLFVRPGPSPVGLPPVRTHLLPDGLSRCVALRRTQARHQAP